MDDQLTVSAHWRDSARSAKLFIIDANAAFPLFLFLIHIRVWTFVVAIAFMMFFALLGRYGYSISVFLRILRAFFAGSRKVVIPWWRN